MNIYTTCAGIDGDRVPLTEIFLMPAEFDEYQIGVDASVTFCLRELKVRAANFYMCVNLTL